MSDPTSLNDVLAAEVIAAARVKKLLRQARHVARLEGKAVKLRRALADVDNQLRAARHFLRDLVAEGMASAPSPAPPDELLP